MIKELFLSKNVIEIGLLTFSTLRGDIYCDVYNRPKNENLNFVFATVKMHSQQPKKELL